MFFEAKFMLDTGKDSDTWRMAPVEELLEVSHLCWTSLRQRDGEMLLGSLLPMHFEL